MLTAIHVPGNFLLISSDTCCRKYRLNVYPKKRSEKMKRRSYFSLDSGIRLKTHVAQCALRCQRHWPVATGWNRVRTEITSGEK